MWIRMNPMTAANVTPNIPSAELTNLRKKIINEIFLALGTSDRGLARKLTSPIFWLPANRFARLVAEIDRVVGAEDLNAGLAALLRRFVTHIEVRGIECIPAQGPLIIASNHPGAYDGLAIMASLPRKDIKVVISEIPFVQSLQAIPQYTIEVPANAAHRLGAVRQALRHLRQGGALLIFPSGQVDPDPDWLPGAHQGLERWSASLALWLHKTPEARLLPVITSSVISPRWVENPLVRAQKGWKRYRLAEFFQVMEQLLFNRPYDFAPRVSFGEAWRFDSHSHSDDLQTTQAEIIAAAQRLLAAHMLPGETLRLEV